MIIFVDYLQSIALPKLFFLYARNELRNGSK